MGYPLGALNNDTLADIPVDGKAFLRAWQLSLRSCSMRNMMGLSRFLMSKSDSVDQWRIVHQLIDFHINEALGTKSRNAADNHNSLLYHLLQQTDDKIDIRNQIMQVMMASQDTTSVLISNTVFLLSRHLNVWNRLRDEVGSTNPNNLTSEGIKKFRLLRHMLYECGSSLCPKKALIII